MQIDTAHTVTVTSSLSAPATAMTLDQDGMAHLMSVLTNLYADKHLAVLREYSTNALDAHVAAGNPDPIEVSLPTALNPTLVISDRGVGLSRQEITEVYAKYGASTKRDTNTQVGSFGLGAKSAFTIGGQFVVTATKDERRTTAVFALDSHGVGSVSILAEHEVPGADNGVTVSIAVSDTHAMREAADKFFQAWRPGTVLVDGAEPESFFTTPGSMWLGDDVLYAKRAGITVVMGSVAYPMSRSAMETVRERTGGQWSIYADHPGLVVFVPIGAVDITPSREAIRDTERSIAAVSGALMNLRARFTAKLTELADANPDPTSMVLAARPYLAAAETLRVPVHTSLPADIVRPAATMFGRGQRGGLSVSELDVISAKTLHLVTVLVGVPAKRSARRHAKEWLDEHSNRRMLIMIGDGAATEGQLDWFRWGGDSPVPTVHFDSIVPPERASVPRSQQVTYHVRQPNPGDYHRNPVRMTLAEIKDYGLPVAYLHGSHGLSHHASVNALAEHLVIELTGQQSEDVLVKRLPGVVRAADVIAAWTQAQLDALGADLDTLVASMGAADVVESVVRVLGVRADQLTHPTWLSVVADAAAYNALSEQDRSLILRHSTEAWRRPTDALERDLPLLMHTVTWNRYPDPEVLDHLVLYVNAVAASAA